jgi:hypothetical protein
MKNPTEFSSTGSFNIAEIAASLPETAATLLVDQYLTNRDAAQPFYCEIEWFAIGQKSVCRPDAQGPQRDRSRFQPGRLGTAP